MTAHAMTDWCRFTGVDPSFIDPASPWQNGTCESFNGRFRDEFLTTEQFCRRRCRTERFRRLKSEQFWAV